MLISWAFADYSACCRRGAAEKVFEKLLTHRGILILLSLPQGTGFQTAKRGEVLSGGSTAPILETLSGLLTPDKETGVGVQAPPKKIDI